MIKSSISTYQYCCKGLIITIILGNDVSRERDKNIERMSHYSSIHCEHFAGDAAPFMLWCLLGSTKNPARVMSPNTLWTHVRPTRWVSSVASCFVSVKSVRCIVLSISLWQKDKRRSLRTLFRKSLF